jgi:ArsR family transcriptional regulator
MDVSKYQQKAELLKTLGHPVRLCIVHGLMHNACNVSGIQECLKLPQSTISQHLGTLKARGIIKGERRGVEVKYSVVHDDAIKVVKVLLDDEAPFSTGVKEE